MRAPPDFRVDYDRVAPTYDERYRLGDPPGIGECLRRTLSGARRALDVGCGTGHWLCQAQAGGVRAVGVDRSPGMLGRARGSGAERLVCGDATMLPFAAESFDAVYCVNALHHFAPARQFVVEAARILRPGGRIALIGAYCGAWRERWYLYDYFAGTREADAQRYPEASLIAQWMRDVGFDDICIGVATHLVAALAGRDVYTDPILSRHGTSQLSLLSDGEFDAGMTRIADAIAAAESEGGRAEFTMDLRLAVIEGRAPLPQGEASGRNRDSV